MVHESIYDRTIFLPCIFQRIGVEMEDALAQDDEKTVESMVERTIRDALLVNPRTEWVRDFEFEWNGDSMNCSFKVKGKEWDKVFQINI